MKKIAITGTIGSGKSTVSIIFKRHGIPVFDADGYSKLCLMNLHPAALKIKDAFKESILDENGEINRKKLADVVFKNEEKRQLLNSIVHPYIKEGLVHFFERHEKEPLVCAEVALLYECGWEDLFDKVIVVTCKDEIAIDRLVEYREFTKEEAIRRLEKQINKEDQIARADIVIYNDTSLQDLNSQVLKCIRENKEWS